MNKILTIVVTYNRINLLKECIDALHKSSIPVDILIVNNNSTDNTEQYCKQIIENNTNSKIYYYNTGENLGGAGGFNFGIKKALENYNYEYLWIMDDDCIVKNDSIEKLLFYAKKFNDDFGFLSSKVLWKDNNICKTNIQRRVVARKINDFTSPVVKVHYASFVSLFVKTSLAKEVGLPIKDFFIWTDDLEWTRRLSRKYNSYLINDSVVIHKCNHNFGVDITKDTNDRIDRYKYIYRNDYWTFKQEGLKGYIFLYTRLIYHIIKVMFMSDSKFLKIKTILNGYNEGKYFSPKIEYVK